MGQPRHPRFRGRQERCARWFLRAACSLALVALASCARTPTPVPTPAALTVSGSTSMEPLLQALAERFRARYPSIAVTVEGGDSAKGMARLDDGSTSLGAVSVSLPAAGWAAPIAQDAIAVIVHRDNPLADLTLAQLYDVFEGRVWHWSDLGLDVAEDEITVVSREAGSGTRAAFEALVMSEGRLLPPECQAELLASHTEGAVDLTPGASPPCEVDLVTSTAVVMPGSEAVIAFVAAHPGAIGYVSLANLALPAERTQGVDRVRAVRVEGVPADPAHLADGSYSLWRPFLLVTPAEPTGAPRLFVDFCLGREGQALVAECCAPVRPER